MWQFDPTNICSCSWPTSYRGARAQPKMAHGLGRPTETGSRPAGARYPDRSIFGGGGLEGSYREVLVISRGIPSPATVGYPVLRSARLQIPPVHPALPDPNRLRKWRNWHFLPTQARVGFSGHRRVPGRHRGAPLGALVVCLDFEPTAICSSIGGAVYARPPASNERLAEFH